MFQTFGIHKEHNLPKVEYAFIYPAFWKYYGYMCHISHRTGSWFGSKRLLTRKIPRYFVPAEFRLFFRTWSILETGLQSLISSLLTSFYIPFFVRARDVAAARVSAWFSSLHPHAAVIFVGGSAGPRLQ